MYTHTDAYYKSHIHTYTYTYNTYTYAMSYDAQLRYGPVKYGAYD